MFEPFKPPARFLYRVGLGFSDDQVSFLIKEKAIYIVKGGRINVAGLAASNLDYVCDAIAGL